MYRAPKLLNIIMYSQRQTDTIWEANQKTAAHPMIYIQSAQQNYTFHNNQQYYILKYYTSYSLKVDHRKQLKSALEFIA